MHSNCYYSQVLVSSTGYFALTIYVDSLFKNKCCKRHEQKNIQKKAIQTKINLYNNKYIKGNIIKHYKYSNIVV